MLVNTPKNKTNTAIKLILVSLDVTSIRNKDLNRPYILIPGYNLTWKEANGSWQNAWSSKGTSLQGTQEYTLQGLKCGTKYSLRMTAANSVGSSQPTYFDATTLGGGKF